MRRPAGLSASHRSDSVIAPFDVHLTPQHVKCPLPRDQAYSKVGIGGELRAGSAGIEGILPSFEGGMPSIPGYSRRTKGQDGETRTPNGDF